MKFRLFKINVTYECSFNTKIISIEIRKIEYSYYIIMYNLKFSIVVFHNRQSLNQF